MNFILKKGLLCVFLLISVMGRAQDLPVNEKLMYETWPAYWITHKDIGDQDFAVLHFKKTFTVDNPGDKFIIHVSGDSRYKLYVNGTLVCHGPASSDFNHWNFETVNIAKQLKAGDNIIFAEVWNFGPERAQSTMSYGTGFILQGDGEKEQLVNTDQSWTVLDNKAYASFRPKKINTDIGSGEFVDFNKYAAEPWSPAKTLDHGETKRSIRNNSGRLLTPRAIPQMELKNTRLVSLRKVEGFKPANGFPKNKAVLNIPANSKVVLLLDQEELINAYPSLLFSKGKNARINIGYAESLYDAKGGKGNRNEITGKNFTGFQDEIVSAGAEQQQYTTLWWRTYRYVQLTIETKSEPLIIEDFYGVKTGYPFELKARFSSDDPSLNKILTIGWRTATLCAAETYMDCPYYERLQYVGDTRIQALVSLYNSGDDRLMRQAIEQLNNSRMAEGITLSRYPTNHTQQIPPFSLWWIGIVSDYWMYRGDADFIRKMLPGVRQVLSFFKNLQQQDGSLKNVPYWNFTDWADKEGWDFGVPPQGNKANSAIIDLQLLMAYQVAAKLENALGVKQNAENYQAEAAKLSKTINQKYWSAEKGLFADEDQHRYYSQHANILAVLTDVVQGTKAKSIMGKVLSDTSLAQTSIYFKYYQSLALRKVGLTGLYLDMLGIWHDHIKSGLTTWGEISDPNLTRSDCHAWGASPNIEIYRMVLGIDSDAPGFSKVKIAPALGKLLQASGTIPHPKGEIAVSYKKRGDKWDIRVKLPAETPGTLIWKGKSYPLEQDKETVFSME